MAQSAFGALKLPSFASGALPLVPQRFCRWATGWEDSLDLFAAPALVSSLGLTRR
jgi:hypothetical protein